ncbi:MAG: hypothetical protein ABWY37_02470 [Microbacterium pygmaeum]
MSDREAGAEPGDAEPKPSITQPKPPAVEPPSPDVAPVGAESGVPGRHRGGFERWPTAPVGVLPEELTVEGPSEDQPLVLWAPPEPRAPYRGLAAWSLGFAIAALVLSMFIGWAFPVGLAAIIAAIVALRRPLEPRGVAVWAIVLGAISVIYSAGWLMWAGTQVDLFV